MSTTYSYLNSTGPKIAVYKIIQISFNYNSTRNEKRYYLKKFMVILITKKQHIAVKEPLL